MFGYSCIWICSLGPPGFGRLDEGLAPARTGARDSGARRASRRRHVPSHLLRSAATLLVNMILRHSNGGSP